MFKKIFTIMFLVMFLAVAGFSQAKKEEIKLDAKACYLKCIELLKTGDVDNATKFGEKAVALDNKNSDYCYQLGIAYSSKLNHKSTEMMEKLTWATKMLEAWEKAVKLDGKNIKARQGLISFYLVAPPIAGGSVEKAEQQAKELLKLDELMGLAAYVGIYAKQKDFVRSRDYANKAFKMHMEFKKKFPGKKSGFNSGILNNMGYEYINLGKMADAIEVFKMNVEAYPDFFNTYDSLGEAYAKAGKTELAIKNYEKALALNPNKTDKEKNAYQDQVKVLQKLKAN
jgi:tetratricopeptide (TPR) repeat protein